MHLYKILLGNPSILSMEDNVHERVRRGLGGLTCMCPCACTTTTTTESTTTSKVLMLVMSDVFSIYKNKMNITIFNKKSLSNTSLQNF